MKSDRTIMEGRGLYALWNRRRGPLAMAAVFTAFLLLFACGNGGGSSSSETVTAELEAPTEVSVTAGVETCRVQWSSMPNATAYNVYWSNEKGVTKQNGNKFSDCKSPHFHTNLTNGMHYYYVVTAVYPQGESPESQEVSAAPMAVLPDVPVNVTAIVTRKQPGAITIQWDPVAGADYYNLYWNTEPGVTKATGTKITDATTPYIHADLVGGTTYYYVVTAVASSIESGESAEVSATARGPREGGGGGSPHEEGFGNNLSFPLVFADGYGITGQPLSGADPAYTDYNTGLRPTSTEVFDAFPFLDPDTIYTLDGVDYYQQKTASAWQADWVDGSGSEQHVIVDWGDNLTSQRFTTNSVIRVETVLYQDTSVTAPEDTLTAYTMKLLYGSGMTEMQGTDGTTYESNVRNLYALQARLKIEKLTGPGGEVDPTVPVFDKAVYESFGLDGPGAYTSEINVSGKLVYGYVWMLNRAALTEEQKAGWWRLTFSLDPNADIGGVLIPNNTLIDALDPSETAAVLVSPTETRIEVQVTTR